MQSRIDGSSGEKTSNDERHDEEWLASQNRQLKILSVSLFLKIA